MTWHPIATAPKDGTELLLLRDRRIVSGSWNSGGALHMPHWMGGIFDPTHWMPLPPPPEVETYLAVLCKKTEIAQENATCTAPDVPEDGAYVAHHVVPTYPAPKDIK